MRKTLTYYTSLTMNISTMFMGILVNIQMETRTWLTLLTFTFPWGSSNFTYVASDKSKCNEKKKLLPTTNKKNLIILVIINNAVAENDTEKLERETRNNRKMEAIKRSEEQTGKHRIN